MTRLALITGLAATASAVALASLARSDTPSPSEDSPDLFDGNLKWIDGAGHPRELIWELVRAGRGGPSIGLAPTWWYGSQN